MKREEILADDELDNVIGGAQTVQIPKSTLNDIKSEMNPAELVPINKGSFVQKFKGIFQRMQPD